MKALKEGVLFVKIALAQVKFFLGDFDHNCEQVLEILKKAEKRADLVAFPEGGLWGYPPKDFLYHDRWFELQEKKFQIINKHLPRELLLLLPAFIKNKNEIQNGVFLFEKGKKSVFFAKEFLPDHGVFFESRYFKKGKVKNNFFYWKNRKIQIFICEDLWRSSLQGPADLLLAVNSSPYTDQKQKNRLKKMEELTKRYKCPSVYLNRVGGQDSLIFDGGSFVLNCDGDIVWQGQFFEPDFKILNVFKKSKLKKTKQATGKPPPFLNLQEQREQALILGIKDFFSQAGWTKAHLGLSGGMDSALVAYLAERALGKNNLTAYFLPGPYTQKISYRIVRHLSRKLQIQMIEKDITPLIETFSKWFFSDKACNNFITLQNIQARLRALILMAVANESSSLLLSTGNKSEMATGYSTLYGDMAGALCPIADLLKTQVYDVASFINEKTKIFPKDLFLREPSAELAPEQKDHDDLPRYKELDPLLENIFKGMDPKTLTEQKLVHLVQKQEFKRFQAPPILKVSELDLGESWKKPIVHKFPPLNF